MEYTQQERELQELVQGPDPSWREDFGGQNATEYPAGVPEDLPEAAKEHLVMATRVRKSEEAKVIAGAPVRLRAYCHGRLLDVYLGGQTTTIEEILQDAVELGG